MLNKLKKHWWQILLGLVGLLVLGAAFMLVRPDTYLPHKRIVLHVPYDLNDPPINLIPMGEKIYHANAPKGHPGIDFQWNGPDAKILSSSSGKISSIKLVMDKWNKWEIDVTSGPYVVRYKEMETYNQSLKSGQHVNIGDFLGHPANPKIHNEVGAYQIHWEFGSPSVVRDRFCPMTYFDAASRQSVEKVWAKTNWQYKSQYPNVCSGDYANKTE
jgi:hypothetical protein